MGRQNGTRAVRLRTVFCQTGCVSGFLGKGSRINKCQYLYLMGAGWNFCGAVCPVKADMFSRKEAYRGKSQKPLSLGCIRGGNEADEANAACIAAMFSAWRGR